MPLASWTAVPKDDDPYAAQHRRNRLETLLSFIAFTIKNQGIASAFELKVHGDRLNLLLAGSDAKGIEAELQRYFELLRLPERGKMVVFTAGSDMPEEVELDK
jgi:hypothetical protein